MNKDEQHIIQKLAEMQPTFYEDIRIYCAAGLKIEPVALDIEVQNARDQLARENSMPFKRITPWHEPISSTELLDEIAATVKRFIVCQNETVTAVTLWIAMTWFIDEIQIAPLAVITAPEKRCGKSQLLSLINRLVYRPIIASNITPAALFRMIDAWHPTLLIDEADTFIGDNEELRGLVNCGHTRDTAYVIRTVGKEHTPKSFFVWGAKALAGIGRLPATIMDRAIILELRRKKAEEQTERLRHTDSSRFVHLSAMLARFALDYADNVRVLKPHMPDSLNDRAQDNWEPLFAIAEIAGDKWLRLANIAAFAISGNTDQSHSIGVELLKDIQDIIESKRDDRISTSELIEALCRDTEQPWATYNRGNPITPRQVANQLKSFGIQSGTIRIGTTTAKGYLFLHFQDAFSRYLTTESVASVTA